jgi:O-methyltransferase involved in polyketide biosynthesis
MSTPSPVSNISDTARWGCDAVVNLAAGLDTRPYRMAVPSSLRWVEVDLPALSAEKERLLADARPRCPLTRIHADLSDAAARARALRQAVGTSARVLVLTEGLLIYLDDSLVRALSGDLRAEAGVRWWVLDLSSPAILSLMNQRMGVHLQNAPLKFAPPNGIGYFEALGWKVSQVESMAQAAVRLHRLPWSLRPFTLLPRANPRDVSRGRWAAVVQLESAQH